MKNKIKYLFSWTYANEKIYKLYLKAKKYSKLKNKTLVCFYQNKIYNKYHCVISASSSIKGILNFPHPMGIVIGEGVYIGKNVTIYQNVTLGRKNKDISEYPTIEDDVIIYCNSTIIGNVTIGKGAIVGCNSVVLRDVKPGEVVSGIVK